MAGIDLGTAFLQITPSFRGALPESDKAGKQMGKRAGDSFVDEFGRQAEPGIKRSIEKGSDKAASSSREAGKKSGGGFLDGFKGAGSGEASGESFLSGLKGKAMAGVAGIAVAAAGAFTAAYSEALDVKAARAKASAQLGLTPQQAKELGATAGKLYSTGYGESLSEATDLAATVQSTLGLTGDALTAAAGKASSFAAAFDTDVADSVQSVGTLMRSGLVKDADEAFDLLTAASQKVPAALRGNVAEASDEYSQFFAALGFSGEEAFDALVVGAQKGEFGIDKTGDAIKEFTIRTTDGSATTKTAFEAIGLDATKMSNDILAGGDQAKGATDKIIEGILGIEDPSKRAQTALALFGTPLEDMNVTEIPQFLQGLQGVSGSLGETEGAAAKVDAAMGSTTSSFELMYRSVKTNVVDFFIDKVLPAIAEGAMWLGEHLAPAVEKVGIWFNEKLVPFLKLAWEWFEVNLLPAIMRLGEFIGSTFQNIMDVIGGVMDFLVGVFTGDWDKAWSGIKEIFSAIWNQIKGALSAAWDIIVGLIQSLGPKVLEIIQGFFGMMVEKGREFLSWLWNGITAFASDTLWPWFTSLPGWIWDRIAAFAGWVTDRGKDFLSWLWDGIKATGEDVLQWFSDLPGWVWDKIQAAAAWVTLRGEEFIGWIAEGIKNGAVAIWDFFTSLPGKAWDALIAIKDKILSIGSDFVGWVIDGIKSVAGQIWDAITNALTGGGEANDDGTVDVNNLGVTLGGGGARGAIVPAGTRGARAAFSAGGILPGADPGRRDNLVGILPSGERFGLRSREAIMVPEFTDWAEQRVGVHGLNRMAEAGRLDEVFGMSGGFALGGIAGTAAKARQYGIDQAWARAKEVIDAAKAGASTVAAGGFNPSQDPSSFGWTRAANQQAFSWGGMGTSVAGGTQGLWTSLLNTLNPTILGGITNIGGFEDRDNVNSPGTPSFHSYGLAMDVNAPENPNGVSAASIQGNRGAIPIGIAQSTAARLGMLWGGDFNGTPDPMHFEIHVAPSAIGAVSSAPSTGVGMGISSIAAAVAGKLGISFGAGASMAPGGGGATKDMNTVDPIVDFGPMNMARGTAAMVGPIPPGDAEGRWTGIFRQALKMKGRDTVSNLENMMYQMHTESSGDPLSYNDWDSNYTAGHPSKGLLQTIPSTFRAYSEPGYGTNIWDPLSNALAAVNYVMARYGGVFPGHAYDNGGMLGPKSIGVNMLTQPEAVLTPPETRAYQAHAAALAQGFGGQVMQIEIRGGTEIEQVIARTADIRIDGAIVEAVRGANRMAAQG